MGLLKLRPTSGSSAVQFAKEFASYHLPERSFLYLLHAMRDEKQSPSRVLLQPK